MGRSGQLKASSAPCHHPLPCSFPQLGILPVPSSRPVSLPLDTKEGRAGGKESILERSDICKCGWRGFLKEGHAEKDLERGCSRQRGTVCVRAEVNDSKMFTCGERFVLFKHRAIEKVNSRDTR